MKSLLITGASGFLGWNLIQVPQKNWKLHGTYYSNPIRSKDRVSFHQLDLTNFNDTTNLIDQIQPDVIIHLAANSSPANCQKNPKSSFLLNVASTENLATIAFDKNIQFLFASSEQVYDGNKANYTETDEPLPINIYGEQKLKAEKIIQSINTNATIVRLAVMYGQQNSFMQEWLSKWSSGESITAFHDEYRSFLDGQSAAKGLFHLLENNLSGVYNLGGLKAFSRVEFAEQLAQTFEITNAKIISKSQHDIPGLAEVRPSNLQLDCTKIINTGFTVPNLNKALSALFQNY